jgi:hypothetical protein
MGPRSLHNLLCKNFCTRRPRPARSRLLLETLEDRTVPSFLAPVDYPAGDGGTLAAATGPRNAVTPPAD